jgi:hypothetical protein
LSLVLSSVSSKTVAGPRSIRNKGRAFESQNVGRGEDDVSLVCVARLEGKVVSGVVVHPEG